MRDPRPWTYSALFGVLWGVAEMSLGTVLRMARVPFYGILMAVLGLIWKQGYNVAMVFFVTLALLGWSTPH